MPAAAGNPVRLDRETSFLQRVGPSWFVRGGSAVFFLLSVLAGCDRGPSEVRDWTPGDHDQPQAAAGQVSARPGAEGVDPTLINMAWQRNCATCHGPIGRGDGPQGPMVRAPDLTRSSWQENISDEEIATIIRKGKSGTKMPGFDLPDQVIQGLVQRIRAARAK